MDTNIYYISEHKAVSITNNFEEIQKLMDLGVNPRVEYIPMISSDFSKYEIGDLGFDKADNSDFQKLKGVFSKLKFTTIAFHESDIDLSDIVIDVQHLLIGDKSKVNISEKNFKNLKEITFLELKTYKGKVLTKFDSVKKIIMWYEAKKANSILPNFSELKELHIFNGSEVHLDLRQNKYIEILKLANFPKLEKVLLSENNLIKEFTIENCKKLDVHNLPITSI